MVELHIDKQHAQDESGISESMIYHREKEKKYIRSQLNRRARNLVGREGGGRVILLSVRGG